MDRVLISVVIPVFNGERFIVDCINSVLKQDYQANEIIVVNDGSNDGTERLVKEAFNQDVLLHSQKNKGRSAARNVGIQLAKSEYVAFLDADDRFLPGHLSNLASAVGSGDQIIFDAILYPGAEKKDVPLLYAGRKAYKHLYRPKIPVQCSMVNRDWVLEKKIKFDEQIRVSEDSLFFKQMILMGAQVAFVCDYGCLYNLHDQQTTRNILASRIESRDAAKALENFVRDRNPEMSTKIRRCLRRESVTADAYITLGKVYFSEMKRTTALKRLFRFGFLLWGIGIVARIRCILAVGWVIFPVVKVQKLNQVIFGEYALHELRYQKLDELGEIQ